MISRHNAPVQVASFGDYFADKSRPIPTPTKSFNLTKPAPTVSEPLSVSEVKGAAITDETPATFAATGESMNSAEANGERKRSDASSPRKRHGHAAAAEGPVETLTYRDPFAGVYKKYVFHVPHWAASLISL